MKPLLRAPLLLAFAAAVWLVLTSLPACTRRPPPAKGPNVLLLTVDTLRPDYLSHSGYDRPTTPVLDQLIAQGTWFSRAVAPVPRTTPALASLLTGLHPHHHGVRRLFDNREHSATTLAQVAQANGYQTIAVLSNHVVKPERGLNAGFDVYNMQGDKRVAAQTTRDAVQALGAAEAGRAVFLWVHYIDPHVPYRPPETYAAQFDPDYVGPYATHFGGKPGAVGNNAYPKELGKHRSVFANTLAPSVNAHIRRLYAGDVRQTDDAIGTLLEAIREAHGDDWIVVFTADHGESLGEHDYFYDHGDYVYNAGMRVPLAFVDLRAPRTAVQSVDTWVSLIDVAPTLAEWLGWRWPRAVDGRSLLGAVRGAPLPDQPVFGECGKNFKPNTVPRRIQRDVKGRFRTAISGDRKLIYTPGATQPWELYDVEADPHETVNLWATESQSEAAASLVGALQAWMADDTMAEPPATPAPEDIEALKALGYIDDN